MTELITLCMMVTADIKHKYGRIAMQCKQASNMLIKRARKEGLPLVIARGFFFGEQHWWTKDPNTGDIYDPTGAQFPLGRNGYIPTTDPTHSLYEEVDEKMDLWLRGTASSELYSRYLYLKSRMSMFATKGTDSLEFREDKSGNTYLYVSYQIDFDPGKREGVRSMVVYRSRKYSDSFNAYINYQRMEKKGDQITFPVRQKRIYFRNTSYGWMSINLKTQEITEDGHLLHDIRAEMSQLPIIKKEN